MLFPSPCLGMSRHTQPEKDVALLLSQLGLTLPEQPPPKVYASDRSVCSADLFALPLDFPGSAGCIPLELRKSG
ncbi:MAG: hypothetical protein L3J18_08490 [Candidatus Brocadia sp.]|uniref:Uncharacterized protein n=1 Tax=Candidatus Brocadia fulgida TaxID=380242 RepID=A0A0M2UQ06_9BACT|nr:MAG: hypothetical protein BROFUL_03344 [Candidatus Brocadia fulgida]OQZ03180.1 MAG: hypothetical protein B6D35_00345 [Candidatus Brocadia sp. UTAMX2]UJS22332.1 MAG: hypothetical protein L3J18_08490 [Candidatus Brocadia sp.]